MRTVEQASGNGSVTALASQRSWHGGVEHPCPHEFYRRGMVACDLRCGIAKRSGARTGGSTGVAAAASRAASSHEQRCGLGFLADRNAGAFTIARAGHDRVISTTPIARTIACLDVAYGSTAAAVACVMVRSWDASGADRIEVRRFDGPAERYEPGAFYRRELPLLRSVISGFEEMIEVIVVDGYVWLDADGQPGLGGHLFAGLGCRVPVIGVAKTRYLNDTWSTPVLRGASRRPLFVTSAGVDGKTAAECVRRMDGSHRIPTILALADRAAREELARET